MSVQGFATVAAQTPAGGLIDRIHAKRAAVALAALAVALGVVAMAWWSTLPVIIAAQAVIGASSAIFVPAVSAISLGLVGHGRLPRRMGRNEAFNHAGNVAAALLAGWIGDHVAKVGVFYLVAAMSAATVATTLLIRRGDIDYALARAPSPTRATERASGSPVSARCCAIAGSRRSSWPSPSSTSPTRRCSRWSARSSPTARRGGSRPTWRPASSPRNW